MKTTLKLKLIMAVLCGLVLSNPASSQDRDSILAALKTIDPNLLKFFPRWRVCEPNLQIQINQVFALNGLDRGLDMQNIIVTAGPVSQDPNEPYNVLIIEDGSQKMVASELDAYMKKLLTQITDRGRKYCYKDIPAAEPPSSAQIDAIIDYMAPTNVNHSYMVSAFEQAVKIGNTGFWLRSIIGTDQIGYHFWSAGEAKVVLQRPLYVNDDPETRKAIPYLLNARIGAGYRLAESGLSGKQNVLSFLPSRSLNTIGAKAVAGLDFYMPFHPQAGFSVNMEIPTTGKTEASTILLEKYALASAPWSSGGGPERPAIAGRVYDQKSVVYLLRTTGQVTTFYNFWLDANHPEDFFRMDVGMNYTEVSTAAVYSDSAGIHAIIDGVTDKAGKNVLPFYHPTELADWLYLKLEYRNQSTFPFGASIQYSNQNLLSRVYLPLLGDWLYIEAKYTTSMRDKARPYEPGSFFIISPVLRLNI